MNHLANSFFSASFQVSVDIGSSSIHVSLVEGRGRQVLMEGALTHKINTETSVWSLEPGKCILVRITSSFPFRKYYVYAVLCLHVYIPCRYSSTQDNNWDWNFHHKSLQSQFESDLILLPFYDACQASPLSLSKCHGCKCVDSFL